MTEELCGAVVDAKRLMDMVNLDGLSGSMEGGIRLPRCVLPKGHHPCIGGCCSKPASDSIHAPGHMLDQSLFLPPEPPKCGALWFDKRGMRVYSGVIDQGISVAATCILDAGHAGAHDSGLGEWPLNSEPLCVCGHRKTVHWLRGGDVGGGSVQSRGGGTRSAPWRGQSRNGNGRDPGWPPYYRAECCRSTCGCPAFSPANDAVSPSYPPPVHKKLSAARGRT